MSAENEPVKCQEWLGDDSMTITSGTISITGAPINTGAAPPIAPYIGACEYDGKNYYGVLPSGERVELGLVPIGATVFISEIEKELKAWRERFPEYTYNSDSGLICYKVSVLEEEN